MKAIHCVVWVLSAAVLAPAWQPVDIAPVCNGRVLSDASDGSGVGFRGGANEKFILPSDLKGMLTLADGTFFRFAPKRENNGIRLGLAAAVSVPVSGRSGVRRLSFLTCGVGLNPMPDKSPNGDGTVTIVYTDGSRSVSPWVIGSYASPPPSPARTALKADLRAFSTDQTYSGRYFYAQIVAVDPKKDIASVEFSTKGIRDGSRDDAEFAVLAVSTDDKENVMGTNDGMGKENWALPAEFALWTDEDREAQKKAAVKLQGDINAAIASGKKEIIVPPGHYRLDPDGPLTALYIKGASNVTLICSGATLWGNGVKKQRGLIVLHECSGMTVRGLTCDMDPYSSTQGEIISIDLEKGTADIAIEPGFPLPDETWQRYKGSTKTVFFDRSGDFIPNRMDWSTVEAHLGGRNFRVKFQHNFIALHKEAVRAGDRLALPKRQYTTGVHMRDSERCTLEDITIYASTDLSIYETGGVGGHTYRRCKVIRRPGTKRLVAGNADVFRSIKVARGPLVEECEFSYACDDLFNLQNYWWAVHERTAPDEAILGVIDNVGVEDIVGDTVEFFGLADFAPRGSVKVISAQRVTDASVIAAVKDLAKDPAAAAMGSVYMAFAPMKVKFDRPIDIKRLDLMLTARSVPRGAVIRNNYLHHCYTRGILMKTFDGRVENNRIEKIGAAAIQMVADTHFWEGPPARNVVISNNTITDCGWASMARLWLNNEPAAIVSMQAGKHSRPVTNVRMNSRISIVDNTITRPYAGGVIMRNTDGGVIRGNRIDTPYSRPFAEGVEAELISNSYAIFIEDAKDIEVAGNSVMSPGAACRGDVFYGERTPGCRGQGRK